jgi:hypothetical protein
MKWLEEVYGIRQFQFTQLVAFTEKEAAPRGMIESIAQQLWSASKEAA